jgi:hypothetical protein
VVGGAAFVSFWLPLRSTTSGVVARARPLDLPGVAEVSQLSSLARSGVLSVASRASSGQPLALLLDHCGTLDVVG